MNSIILENEEFVLEVNNSRGTIESLHMKQDRLGTEFIGNRKNTSYPAIRSMDQWMGDIRIRVWDEEAHDWTLELSSKSGDTREIRADEGKGRVQISYEKPSSEENGIRSAAVTETYCMEPDGLHWYLSVRNPSNRKMEIGEISLSFLTNTDFTGIFEDPAYADTENWRGIKQKLWHEQRVQQHLSINGGSSYAYLQRPRGDYPAVLFQALEETKLEAAYQMDPLVGCQWSVTFEGPYYLALYSNAARKCGGWKYETEQQSYGMNGNTSLLLEPGQEKCFHFVFHAVSSEKQVRDLLYQEDQLDIEVQPSMAVPAGIPVQMRIRSREQPSLLPVSNHIKIEEVRTEGDCYYFRLHFTDPGQKKIKVLHGKKETTVLFYAIDNVRKLLENRAEFIVNRQYYENPLDPFGRHHAFLPYDDALETLFTESEESWQVGALDEYALPVAMYTAEKNSILPDEHQIDILEEYIEDCLYGILQERETYYARRGMYYEERTPSDVFFGNKWDKEKAESILRSFNYPLISDIYFSMYKIADRYGLTKRRTKQEYLEMAYRTAMTGYELGRNKLNGAPAGATIIELLTALKTEAPEWYGKLNQKISFIADENAASVYPFGSELYVDQTSHNQYEAMMRYYGKHEKLEEAYRITCALRGGLQPEWFLYGNEKRGNVCCWYGTPLNSRVLFNGFGYTGNQQMLKLGFAGLFSFLTCIRSNGAAHGWFLWWPDRSGFDFRSLDTDMGMYGYLYAARSYVVEDEIFGRCGYGCQWERCGSREMVTPYDGLGIRFCSVPHKLRIECRKGCISNIIINEEEKRITVGMEIPYSHEPAITFRAEDAWTVEINGLHVTAEAGKETVIG